MRIYHTCPGDMPQGAVLAIGNFDGVHRGHAALLRAARAAADARGAGLAILTFEPHPRSLFQPDGPPFRLTPPPLKARRLTLCGADVLVSLPFDWAFASQSAERFITGVIAPLAPSRIVVGEDFRFGQLRKGTPDMLRAAGYGVDIFPPCADQTGETVSSSRIRAALARGDVAGANALLGWPWHMEGTVVVGDRRGRTIGYPTANVALGETIHPAYGVYAARVRVEEDGRDSPWLHAAVNIGIRPMFALDTGRIEAHILDFDRDIYGKTLQVRPAARLRGEAKFESLDALVRQIAADCAQTRLVLAAQEKDSENKDGDAVTLGNKA